MLNLHRAHCTAHIYIYIYVLQCLNSHPSWLVLCLRGDQWHGGQWHGVTGDATSYHSGASDMHPPEETHRGQVPLEQQLLPPLPPHTVCTVCMLVVCGGMHCIHTALCAATIAIQVHGSYELCLQSGHGTMPTAALAQKHRRRCVRPASLPPPGTMARPCCAPV